MASFDEVYGRNSSNAPSVPLGNIGRKSYVAVLSKDGRSPLYNIVIIDGGNQYTHSRNLSLSACQSSFKGWSQDGSLIRNRNSGDSRSSFSGLAPIILVIVAVVYALMHGAHF
jgi:hypothetical protein